jgi:hypothetical protein
VQHLEKKYVGYKLRLSQELYNLKMEEGTLMQKHINKFWMIVSQLVNIDHQLFDEDLAFTFLRNLPPSCHTFMDSFNICIDQLSMGLLCGQLL